MTLRVDPEQRFSCSQCGRCCHGFDVVVTSEEIDFYRRRDAAALFRDSSSPSSVRDPFEAIPDMPGLHRIRKRADGACGFLSDDNRCRIHEELGAARKPLTCRLFPYSFHPVADSIVVTASFQCPTIVGNQGPLSSSGESLIALESLRKEWFATTRPTPPPLRLVEGRTITPRSSRVLRDSLLAMLKRDEDIRDNIRRIAATIDDLTRARVRSLSDEQFAEYLSLTVPHAAKQTDAPPSREPSWTGRLLQYGFLYAVAAVRIGIDHPNQSSSRARVMNLRLLAHFHGIGPGIGHVNVRALDKRPVNINSDDVRPIVVHYLRSTIETLGASGRPLVDEVNIATSYLNAAIALASMLSNAAGHDVDRAIFSEAIAQVADVSHARNQYLDWAVARLSGTTDAMWYLAK